MGIFSQLLNSRDQKSHGGMGPSALENQGASFHNITKLVINSLPWGFGIYRFSTFLAVLLFASSNLWAQLNVYFVNVGQGDATYIELPSGGNILIDGGSSSKPIFEFLKAKGVTKIDHVVLTHPHRDHYTGLKKIFAVFEVKNFYDSRLENLQAAGDNTLRELAAAEPGGCLTHYPDSGTQSVTIPAPGNGAEPIIGGPVMTAGPEYVEMNLTWDPAALENTGSAALDQLKTGAFRAAGRIRHITNRRRYTGTKVPPA